MQLNDFQSRYTPDENVVGKDEQILCGVCESVMISRRGLFGPRTRAAAMAGTGSFYDEFECPHIDNELHQKIVRLRIERDKSDSETLKKIFADEADRLLLKFIKDCGNVE